MTYNPASSGVVNSLPIGDEFYNDTGSLISKATPLTVNTVSGFAEIIDVSSTESEVSFGVAFADTEPTSTGNYITMGVIENVGISANFGDEIYVSKSGGLTNVAPDIGVGGFVSGDAIIFVGTIKKNNTNPLLKDLVISIDIRGIL